MPDMFTPSAIRHLTPGHLGVLIAHEMELHLADNAYALQLNNANDSRLLSKADYAGCVDQLDVQYQRYGITADRLQTKEMVRRLERQATLLAQKERSRGFP